MSKPLYRLVNLRLGELAARVLEPEEPASSLLNVVLCHGFGAPGDDLVGLGPELVRLQPELAGKLRFVFPEAPISLAQLGMPFGRAWWELDIESLMGSRNWDRFHSEEPEGLGRARRLLRAALEQLMASTGVGWSKTVLGGFSQGAMLATDLSFALEEAPAGLAILSGTVIHRENWVRKAPTRAGLPVFQSHGRQDPILPYRGAEELQALLKTAGLDLHFEPFHGPHAIPSEVLDGLAAWLLARSRA